VLTEKRKREKRKLAITLYCVRGKKKREKRESTRHRKTTRGRIRGERGSFSFFTCKGKKEKRPRRANRLRAVREANGQEKEKPLQSREKGKKKADESHFFTNIADHGEEEKKKKKRRGRHATGIQTRKNVLPGERKKT